MESSKTGAYRVLTGTMLTLLTLAGPLAAQQQKLNWAVINLKNGNGISEGEAALISDRLRVELFNTERVNVMERDQMQEILKEQGFQQSGACTDQECLAEMGQLLGVNGIVSGSIGKLGSMFMVNLRVIDVQTGRITGVVKEDVRGAIEDVVTRLGPIAGELAGGQGSGQGPETPAAEQPKAQSEEPEREEEAEEDETETAPPAVVIEEEADRNDNYSGMRASFAILPGEPNVSVDTLVLNRTYDSTNRYAEAYYYNASEAVMGWKADLLFFIALGDLFAVSVGPSVAHSGEHFEYYGSNMVEGYTDTYDFRYTALAVEPGFHFVKRWHPIKLNIGGFVNLNMLCVGTDYKRSHDYSTDNDTTDYDVGLGFTVGGGARGGMEFLIGDKMGVNVDVLYSFVQSRVQVGNYMLIGVYEGIDVSDEELTAYPQTTIRMPGLGIAVGFNLYFGT